MGAMKFRAYLA